MADKIDTNFRNSTAITTNNMASVDEQLLHERLTKIAEVSSGPMTTRA